MQPSAGSNKVAATDESAATIITLGEHDLHHILSVPHSVKPGMKLCSLLKIRAQGLWTKDAVTVGFANEGSSLSISLFALCLHTPSILTLFIGDERSEMKQEA